MMIFEGKKILVTGATGSMGKTFVRRVLTGDQGTPKKIIAFSRDEAFLSNTSYLLQRTQMSYLLVSERPRFDTFGVSYGRPGSKVRDHAKRR